MSGENDAAEKSSKNIHFKNLNNILENLLGNQVENLHPETDTEKRQPDITRDLFIWSILQNQIDMAKVFLARMNYRICASLIATKIFRKFHEKANRMDHKIEYATHAEYFENYAIECVKCCDKEDEEQTDEFVLQRIDSFGGVTCLQVCISHVGYSCQKVMWRIFIDGCHCGGKEVYIDTRLCQSNERSLV